MRACASDQRVLMFIADASKELAWSTDPRAWTNAQKRVTTYALRDYQANCPTCKATLEELVVSVEEDSRAYYVELTPV